jgi:ATP phosphoribosyltransferase regulatory subunit
MAKTKPSLLPSGFIDVLPEQAAYESKIIAKLLKNFEQWGYNQVKPPMVEFESNLGNVTNVDKQSFRFMDPESQNMLSIRADMTMQIARMAAIRLKHKPRPLRLSYGGEVLRVKGEGLHAERQLSQAGIELIGDNTPASDAEAVVVAINSLKKVNMEGLSVDFSMPGLSQMIMEDMGTPEDIREELLALIERKDVSSIENLCKTHKDKTYIVLNRLISLAGPASRAINGLCGLQLPQEGNEYCLYLKQMVDMVKRALPDINITIDPIERRGFEYHTGVSFAFFSDNSKDELGRGGRYVISECDNGDGAVGFTLAVNAIQRASPPLSTPKKLFVPFGVDASKWRADGYITMHALSADVDLYAEARRLECCHVLENGELKTISV